MAYVIAEPCIGQKDNSCVEVCPVDCIHPTPDEPDYDEVEMLYIDPDECIDCDACVEACPVDACFAEDQLPDEWEKYIQINADYYKSKSSVAGLPAAPSAEPTAEQRASQVAAADGCEGVEPTGCTIRASRVGTAPRRPGSRSAREWSGSRSGSGPSCVEFFAPTTAELG